MSRTSATGRTALAERNYFDIAPLVATGGNSAIVIPNSDSDTTAAKKAAGIYLADSSFAFHFPLCTVAPAPVVMRKYSGSNPGLNVTMSAGKITFKLQKTSGTTIATVTSDTAVNDGVLHNIGLVADRALGILSIYIDGVLDKATAPFVDVATIYNTSVLSISTPAATFSQVLFGEFGPLRHYNKALSDDEIAQLHAGEDITDGLVHHWAANTPENSLDIAASANNDYDAVSRCPATLRKCAMVHVPAVRRAVSSSLLMSFGVGADFHYDADSLNTEDGVPILDAIPPIFARFNQAAVDFIALPGDIVENYVEADIDAVIGEFDHAKAPIYLAGGNHDIDIVGSDDDADFAGYINTNHSASVGTECFADGLPYYSFDVGDGHCIVLYDSTSGDGTNPYTMSPTQMAWLEADLLANSDKKTVVVLHSRCSGSYAASVTLKMYEDGAGGAAALRAVLEAAGNVVMVVNGHEHSYHCGKINDIWYLNVNSVYSNSQNCAIVRIYTDGTIEVERYGSAITPWVSRR